MRYLILILLVGCSAEVNPRTQPDRRCVDTRDGEKFVLLGSTFRDGKYDPFLGDACVTGDTDTGKTITVCRSHEEWLKCDPDFYATK